MKTLKMHLLLIKLGLTYLTFKAMQVTDLITNGGKEGEFLQDAYRREVKHFNSRCEEIARTGK